MRVGLLRTRKRRIGLLVGSLCLGSVISACAHWGVWRLDDLCLYLRLRYHSPVAHALWRGEIRPGGRIDQVIAMSRPNSVHALGPFLRIDYYPTGDLSPGSISLEGTSLTAKDGRLISAWSYGCTFQRTYFDVSTADENALYEHLLQERMMARSEAARCRLTSRSSGPGPPRRFPETSRLFLAGRSAELGR